LDPLEAHEIQNSILMITMNYASSIPHNKQKRTNVFEMKQGKIHMSLYSSDRNEGGESITIQNQPSHHWK
jgi:hypothetical protein